MTPIVQFQRYVWLVNTLYSSGPITKEEIDRKWSLSYRNNSHENHIPERTFYRDLRAIESIFGVEIKCNRSNNKYEIITNLKDASFEKWLVETISLSNFVMECKDIRKQILVEQMPSGNNYLSPIVNAIKTNHALSVTYQSYFSQTKSQFEMEPYCLKSFKRRWYVLARTNVHDGLRVFALDRFSEMNITDRKYSIPLNFDAEKYFRNYYGVIMNEKPEIVRIWTTSFRAMYLRSLPLHHSQKEIETVPESAFGKNDGHSIFELKIATTFDFIQELRSMGAEVKVLAPQRLVDWMKYDAEKINELYK